MNIFDDFLLHANAVVCALICIRLFCYEKRGDHHHPCVSWIAYLLAVFSGSVTLRIVMGVYETPVDWAEVGMNTIYCVGVFAMRGNLARLFRLPSIPSLIRKKYRDTKEDQ